MKGPINVKEYKFKAPEIGDEAYDENYEYHVMLNGALLAVLKPGSEVEMKRYRVVTALSLIEEVAEKIRENGGFQSEDPIARKLIDFVKRL
jgi:hypothetical protein